MTDLQTLRATLERIATYMDDRLKDDECDCLELADEVATTLHDMAKGSHTWAVETLLPDMPHVGVTECRVCGGSGEIPGPRHFGSQRCRTCHGIGSTLDW